MSVISGPLSSSAQPAPATSTTPSSPTRSGRKSALVDPLQFMQLDAMLSAGERSLRQRARRVLEEGRDDKLLNELYERAEFSPALVDLAKQLGPAGLQIKGNGCPGLTQSETLVLAIELGRLDASFATFYLVHSGLAMASINVAGTPEQKARWLPRMARYELIGAFGLTEPDYGSNATGLQTTARKVPGGWVLNGHKRWIGNATFCDIIVVWARDTASNAIKGFVVEKGMKGFKPHKIDNKMSLRIVQNADFVLDECFVPEDNHLSAAKKFSDGTQMVLESSRAVVAASAAGCLLGAYERALQYCMDRTQFNKPLASFQLVQERLMRALGHLQASILTVIRLGRMMDEGQATMAQIALAKAWVTRTAREAVALCREVVGGNGIISDFGTIKPLMDLEAIYTYEGTYDVNMLIAGRLVTGLSAFV
uniref:Acyl-CoA dehydrogenase n=1 Tax=Vitrella brassicaformis TaxID=1169539 RepID=A0A7S1P0V8_9ALVE